MSNVNRETVKTYRIPKYTISLVRDSAVSSNVKRISSSADVAKVFRAIIGATDREQFVLLCLDVKNRIIGANVVSMGSLSLSIVHPREAFKAAILMNAATVIFGHNHPSGDHEPSPEDRTLTRKLVQGGQILGIRVLDHVIVGDGTKHYYSFADEGQLN